jgi:hypothetical protein
MEFSAAQRRSHALRASFIREAVRETIRRDDGAIHA